MSSTPADRRIRIALDTNILAYAEGVNGEERRASALAILDGRAEDEVVVPVQALGELFVVLVRKAGRAAAEARGAVLEWSDAFEVAETTADVLFDAMEIATAHRLAFWDAVMLAVAAQAGCRLLLSEDLQDGFVWRGVTVRNPFVAGRD
jgi:predicted nucleic acid-binding protein